MTSCLPPTTRGLPARTDSPPLRTAFEPPATRIVSLNRRRTDVGGSARTARSGGSERTSVACPSAARGAARPMTSQTPTTKDARTHAGAGRKSPTVRPGERRLVTGEGTVHHPGAPVTMLLRARRAAAARRRRRRRRRKNAAHRRVCPTTPTDRKDAPL